MVIWIIGKSGSGKTFFSQNLIKFLKRKKIRNIFWIDGDKFRRKYSKDLGYTLVDRKKNSKRIQSLCLSKEKSKIVITSILSLFKDHQRQNKKKFSNYIQIYIKAETKSLLKRNIRKVYSNSKNVVGVDIKFPEPYKSNYVIKNNFDRKFLKTSKKIYKDIHESIFKIGKTKHKKQISK